MATPRLAGGMRVTSCSPISTVPVVTSSSPAINRRSVDFPQPEGPTNTQNSASAMTRSISSNTFTRPNDFPTFRSSTSAMFCSANLIPAHNSPSSLHRPRRQPRHDAPLENEDQEDEWRRHDDRGRHHPAPRQLIGAGASDGGDGDRHGALLGRER